MKAIVRLVLMVAVLTVGPALSASMPMRIALMVDTSAATSGSITLIREGVVAFLDALPPEHEVLLVSTGRRTQVRVPPTTDRKKLKDSARGLSNDNGPTPLIDGLLEIDGRF
ncbi:MAG TPA: VWA domain-containing protein, partial [Vicinamibacterales bacterium]